MTKVSTIKPPLGDLPVAAEPTLLGDPRFPSVSAKLSRFEPENEDALTVTLRNSGADAVEGYQFSLTPPAGRKFGGYIGVTGSHPYDWVETPTAPSDGGRHITVDRILPGMRATLDFEMVPIPRMGPAQALARAACIAEEDAPRAIEVLREAGHELAPTDRNTDLE